MFACQYVFVTLLAVVLVCNSETGDSYIKKPPLACTVDGKQYPLYAKWPSTKPGECVQYTCKGHNEIAGVTCPLIHVAEDPNQVCYDVALENATYPYCCTDYHCVKKSEDSAS